MASSVTRYTNRCSWLTRRDQQPASIYRRGSGFPRPWKWIPHHRLDEIQHSNCSAAFGFDPKTQVLPELRLKDCDSLRISPHLASLDGVPRRFQAWSALAPLVVMPIGDAVHCAATVTGVQFP
jgi:hypothetical protein